MNLKDGEDFALYCLGVFLIDGVLVMKYTRQTMGFKTRKFFCFFQNNDG